MICPFSEAANCVPSDCPLKVRLSVLMENDKLTPEIEDSPTERQIIRAYQSIWDMLSILSEDESKCTVESAKILREEK